MTQARPGNHYMLSRLKPNGQFIDRLLVKMAVTVHTMRIDTLWRIMDLFSCIDSNKTTSLYVSNIELRDNVRQ